MSEQLIIVEDYECKFCKNTFSSKNNLKTHQQRAKYCLKLQPLQANPVAKYTCTYCAKSFNMKHHLNDHLNVCKKKNFLEEKNSIDDKDKYIRELEHKLETERIQKEIYEKLIKENAECIRKIAEQPRTQIQTVNHRITNRLQLLTPFDLDSDRVEQIIKNTIEQKYTRGHALQGTKGLAQFTAENILKDTDGNNMYVCTDAARFHFKYKDDYGDIVKDVKANKLTNMLIPNVLPTLNQIVQTTNDDMQSVIQAKGMEVRNIRTNNSAFRSELSAITTRLPGGTILPSLQQLPQPAQPVQP